MAQLRLHPLLFAEDDLIFATGAFHVLAGETPAGMIGSTAETRKIVPIDQSLNNADHAAELGLGRPSEPVLFMKATSAVMGCNDPVVFCPRGP